ncbi:autotransporter assembly complex protein TamB [Shewanella aestuarii]|uniref:Translocation and assembly module TamB C-terminal domain-containing protein n=1 Tax=Shewanella aestuarii TaxID=1028752 RepID=A0A6G9QI29_9GAMM|nr:translocation/assembly module TamB domain-containing protein [Shewanella aestuarii]QIR14214.1 hypothetical protein HBH39_06710 [Shewanella aestuarii]
MTTPNQQSNVEHQTDLPSNTHATEHQPNSNIDKKLTTEKLHIGLLKQLWRTVKFYTRMLVYIPLIVLVLLAVGIGTPFGSKIAITLVSQLVPNLQLDYQSGTINHNLKLDYAYWSINGIEVELNDLSLKWNPSCLVHKQLCVDTLQASAVKVDIQTALLGAKTEDTHDVDVDESANPQDNELKLPISINLDKAALAQVKVTVNDMHYNASTLNGSAFWGDSGLKVEYLTSTDLEVILPLDEKTPAKNDKDNQWAMADLPDVYMPFPLFVKQLVAKKSLLQIGQRQDLFEHIDLAGTYIGYHISLSQLNVNHTYGDVELIGDLSLVDNYPLNIKAAANIKHIDELTGFYNQQLALELTDDFSQLGITAKLEGDTQINLQGVIDLTQSNIPFEATLINSKLQWPLNQAEYIADINNLMAKGTFNHQQVNLLGRFTSPYHPTLTVASIFNQQSNALDFSQLTIQSEAGDLDVVGKLNFNNGLEWQATVNTNNIRIQNIKALNQQANMRSKVNGHFTSQGFYTDQKWTIGISDAALTGRMNGFPLSLEGQATFDQNLAVNANNFRVTALGAELYINGTADKIWDIDAQLDVPDLSQWLVGARGNIHARIDVNGTSDNPIVSVQANMQKSSYSGAKFDGLMLKAQYQPYQNHLYSIDLTTDNLFWKNYTLDTLTIASTGDDTEQVTSINTSGDTELNSLLTSTTDIIKQTLAAQWSRLNFNNALGQWHLDAPITFAWDNIKQTGQIDAFCISHPHNKFCLTDTVNLGDQGQANINFSGNPGQLFAPILSKNINWDGEAVFTSQINWQPKTKPTAQLNFSLLPGNIELIRNKNNTVSIDYQQLLLTSTLGENQLRTKITADSEGIASLLSEININVTPDRSLDGFINIATLNLEPFGNFFPRLATFAGNLSSNIALAGTLSSPELSGTIKLNEGALELSSNPTLVDKINLGLVLNGQQAQVNGNWQMGEGQASVDGNIYWPNGQVSADLNIKGDNLSVIQPPIAIVNISPDVNLSFDSTQFAVQGHVAIPSGQIKIMQLADGGVALSDDVIFNDSISELEQKASPFAIIADVNIDVGNELTIDGMGLTGKLIGNLRLQQQAFKPPLLFGDIKVASGSYKFMGQTLKINAGEVQFVGPLEVPNLNIEAVKEIKDEDMTAGVRVTGTPMRPSVTIFSNPAKEQAEALSYILTGKGFNNTSDQQNNSLMMGAALSLGSQVDGGAINNIGSTAKNVIETFGFSNVQLDANDDGRVAVSGFIGDSLMVKYGIGVFNPGYEMTVRYYIFSQLYLESVSGTLSQSLDIYYSYDFD